MPGEMGSWQCGEGLVSLVVGQAARLGCDGLDCGKLNSTGKEADSSWADWRGQRQTLQIVADCRDG